ncbi:Crp/Fnr family transcriptional regulator [Kribbella sp. NBC_00709]|uniref:Crp/Fnr family transcriptional regulator n=1 Tax=Kribbella sp. NBC_00709 TaxID=2975972 RepID=UPI002E2ABABE|nr:Crp/Fnr family transcriptional regulator [Kribbella sp. NBC_00709]
MSDGEVAAALGGSFLGELPGELIERLLATGDRIDYPAGSTLYRERSAPRAILVVRGLLRVYMSSPEGRQVTVRYARDRDVLGIAVLVAGPADVGVQTLADCTLFRMDAGLLTTAARTDSRVGWAVAQELSRRLYENLQQTAVNTFGTVRQRVAAHLLDLASAQQAPRGELVAQVSQQELADAVGSVREVVARVLRDFRLARLVATSADRVHILDATGLHDQTWNPDDQ